MLIPVYSDRKKAKTRFFIAYVISVLLLLVIFSSFLQPTADNDESTSGVDSGADYHSAVYQFLHQRMERLNAVCAQVAQQRTANNLSLLKTEERAFYTSVDSLQKSFAVLPDAKNEKELVTMLEAFNRTAAQQISNARGETPSAATANSGNLLKKQLQEKEQRLAELEAQNSVLISENERLESELQDNSTASSQVTPPVVINNGGEWKTRYESMKAAHDRLQESNRRYASQVDDLKKSYKDVVDDNRRLLAQLQAARAGRN
ncbi:MAG: hypothetical protein M3Q06_05590 [Bacteroidota bacterium]|nr:hypothetical protein [Bacteroidota bacterium]